MKRLIVLTSLSFFIGSSTVANAVGILFEDHFDGGTMSPEWVSVRPLQWVQDGWLHTQSDGSVSGRDSDTLVHDGDTTWTDYTFSLTVDPIPTGASSWERAFVHFRTNDTVLAPNGIWYDGYNLSFGGPADGIGHPFLGLSRSYVDGSSYSLFSSTTIPTTSDPWEVVITATGPEIRVWLDGDLVIDVVDTTDPVLHGGIGIGAIWEAEARFDDVVVTPEPSALFLLACGLAGIAAAGRERSTRRGRGACLAGPRRL
jgi:hypothetical protein